MDNRICTVDMKPEKFMVNNSEKIAGKRNCIGATNPEMFKVNTAEKLRSQKKLYRRYDPGNVQGEHRGKNPWAKETVPGTRTLKGFNMNNPVRIPG